MGTNRDGSVYDGFDLRADFFSAFQLNCLCTAFFHQASGIDHCIIDRSLIGHKRHVCDQQSVFDAAGNRCAVMDHILHRYGERVFVS